MPAVKLAHVYTLSGGSQLLAEVDHQDGYYEVKVSMGVEIDSWLA